MKMKNKRFLKGLTAIMLCVIIIVTSLPLAVFASGLYNPCPYFPSAAEDTENPTARRYAAYTNSDGSITVDFPRAFANNERKSAEKKYVKGYLIELVDLGEKTKLHTNTVLLRMTMKAQQGQLQYEFVITADQIHAVSGLENGLLSNHNYNVSITAYDNEGWFSDTLNTAVSDIPVFAPKSDFVPLVIHNNAARAMLNMESNGSYGGAYILTGTDGALSVIGATDQTGVENYTADIEGNTTAKDTVGYGFTLRNISNDGTPEGFMTVYSREMWDYSGAKEVWIWLDLTHVDLYGLAFQMTSNEKYLFRADSTGTHEQQRQEDLFSADNNIFSTAGYVKDANDPNAPENPYCYLQQDDGSWRKVEMPNGTMDLGHFRGYVRVPVEFFCLTKNSVVEADNNNWNTDYQVAMGTDQRDNRNDSAPSYNDETAGAKMDEVYNTYFKFKDPVIVDKAGTPITKALLIQHFALYGRWKTGNGNFITGTSKAYYSRKYGTMLAADLDASNVTNSNSKRAYIENGVVQNRENGYKAIEDMAAAGFSFQYASESSLDRSFFIDNVIFYRTDGQGFPENKGSTGEPISNYYNQKYEIPRAIFYACDQYIGDDPNWGDFRAVRNIEAMIDYYTQAFAKYGWDTSFMSETALRNTAALLKMEDSWNKFITAREACREAGTLNSDNNEPHELVPELVSMIEKMPDPTTSLLMSDETQANLKHIFQIYDQLSLDQLDMLGKRNEEKLLIYYGYMESLLQRNSVPVGDTLAATPYIMFNDFESFTLGTQAYQLEDDPRAGSSPAVNTSNTAVNGSTRDEDLSSIDYRFQKALVTYTSSAFKNFGAHSNDNGTSDANVRDSLVKGNFDASKLRRNAAWAKVDNNGFKGTNGLTMTIDSQYYTEGQGDYNAVSFTRKGAESDDPVELYNQNAGLDSLGDFATNRLKKAVNVGAADPPICLVFYADFSELSNFRVSIAMHAHCANKVDGTVEFEDFCLDFGDDENNRKFWLLSPYTGEWTQCDVSKRIYTLPSDSNGTDSKGNVLTLNNYKGYIMVPLQYFRSGYRAALGGRWDYALNDRYEAMDGLYRIQIGIAPLDSSNSDGNAAAANLDGRSFTIDNVGFSYDETVYRRSDVDNGQIAQRDDINFDEMTDSKSLWSVEFAEIVNSIDPYDDQAVFESLVNQAWSKYGDLTTFQKTHQSVIAAKKLLDIYQGYVDDRSTIPTPEEPYNTLDAVKAAIAELPSEMTSSDSVTGDHDLPYPYDIDTDSIDYSKYGINEADEAACRAEAQRIVELYENSYARLPNTEKAKLSDAEREAILNAYNAALRLKNLEAALDDAHEFKEDFERLYTAPDDVAPGEASKYFFSIEERDDLKDLWDNYRGMTYWTKYMLENMEGTMSDQNEDVVWTLQRLLKNTRTYSVDYPAENTSSSLDGGVIQLVGTYKTLYETTKSAIDGREKVDLDTLKAAYEEYEALVPAYYSIKELYDIWYEDTDRYSTWDTSDNYPKWDTSSDTDGYADGIIHLFPVDEAELDGDVIDLTPDNYSGGASSTYNVTYSVFFPMPDAELSYITIESTNGKMVFGSTNKYDTPYNVKVSGAATMAGTSSTSLAEQEKTVGTVANNTATASSPLGFVITAYLTAKPNTPYVIEDTLIVHFYHGDGTELTDLQKTIVVRYTPDDSYTVYVPAEFPIKWGTTDATDVSYEVETYLSAGASLDVSVAQAAGTTPNMLVNESDNKLPFTPENFKITRFTGEHNTKTKPSDIPTITIAEGDWGDKEPDTYETRLTYTVTYNAPVNP